MSHPVYPSRNQVGGNSPPPATRIIFIAAIKLTIKACSVVITAMYEDCISFSQNKPLNVYGESLEPFRVGLF